MYQFFFKEKKLDKKITGEIISYEDGVDEEKGKNNQFWGIKGGLLKTKCTVCSFLQYQKDN